MVQCNDKPLKQLVRLIKTLKIYSNHLTYYGFNMPCKKIVDASNDNISTVRLNENSTFTPIDTAIKMA